MNPTQFSWTDPTTNVDGSPLAAGEVTGYLIGIRVYVPVTDPAAPIQYPIQAQVAGATAATELLSALGTVLVPGAYAAAIQSAGPVNSAWSAEVTFTIAAPPPPVPNPPSDFSVA